MKERRENSEETSGDSVPTTPQNLYENGGGWNMTQTHEGQGIEVDFLAQKLDATTKANLKMDESLTSINPQTTTSNDVPTTTENLYENEAGWNIAQSNTGQEIEGSFSAQKLEDEIATTPNVTEPLASTNTQTTDKNLVPTSSENVYEMRVGWNANQSQTEPRIEGDLSSQKMETNLAALAQLRTSQLDSSDEQPISTTTQTTERNDVPATPQNLYESDGGWNTSLSQTEQGIEGDFSPRKNELTNLEIQACLKELRQVSTADDYWVLYEQNSQLISEAWKLLRASEQLWIQQICDEGIDPLSKWKEGDRCWLWHPFAQNKWGLATIKQVVRGACGFIYVLRDDLKIKV
jgi:hypothetical protein